MSLVVSKIKVKVTSQGHKLKAFYQRSSFTKFKIYIDHSSKVIDNVKLDDRHTGHSVQDQGQGQKSRSYTENILPEEFLYKV